MRIQAYHKGSSRIELTDGTIWQVPAVDYQFIANWFPGDAIVVMKSDEFSYPYRLRNVPMGQEVRVKLVTESRRLDEDNALREQKKNLELQENRDHILTVGEGSSWEVAPVDRLTTVRWEKGQTLWIERGGIRHYPYTILNRDRRERVSARVYHRYQVPTVEESEEPFDDLRGFPRP